MPRSYTKDAARRKIEELKEELDTVLDYVESQRTNTDTDLEHQTYLNDYAAVRMAGYLEQLCFHAISGTIGEITTGYSQEFINSWFYKSPNLTPKQFRDLFKRFGGEIDDKVKNLLDDGLNRDLLDALLAKRNSVAHGKESSVAGRESLSTYRELVDTIEKFVYEILLVPSALV